MSSLANNRRRPAPSRPTWLVALLVAVGALVGGIDLCANGWKITWNIAAYLLSLEKGVGELLEVQARDTTWTCWQGS